MSEKKSAKRPAGTFDRLIYWAAAIAPYITALPVAVIKIMRFLWRSASSPFGSLKHFAGFLLALTLLTIGVVAYKIVVPIDLGAEPRSVMVEENESFRSIARKLRDGGVISNEYLFRVAAVIGGIDKNILPGRYDFKGDMSIYDVLSKIKRREIATILLSIPEGATVYKIGSILKTYLGIDSAEFVATAMDTAAGMAKYNAPGLEGYLFPETYLFWFGMKIDRIIEMLVAEFQKRTAGILDSCPSANLSRREVLILASIIEAEALYEDEMPLISSVYHNRLRINMLLQADPTVNYAMGGVFRLLKYSDLKYPSPYNTYLHPGLPPGPINSPGLAAINAAINPARTDFLYFVADGKGRHIFSRTLEEHNRAKLRIRRFRALDAVNNKI
jgi:UPF0755 protein